MQEGHFQYVLTDNATIYNLGFVSDEHNALFEWLYVLMQTIVTVI